MGEILINEFARTEAALGATRSFQGVNRIVARRGDLQRVRGRVVIQARWPELKRRRVGSMIEAGSHFHHFVDHDGVSTGECDVETSDRSTQHVRNKDVCACTGVHDCHSPWPVNESAVHDMGYDISVAVVDGSDPACAVADVPSNVGKLPAKTKPH